MKKMMFGVVAALVMVVTACSNEDVATNDVQYVKELKVNFASGSRIAATSFENGLKFAWEENDKIVVVGKDLEDSYRCVFYYNPDTQTFGPLSEDGKLEVGKEYFAMHLTYDSYNLYPDSETVLVKLKLSTQNYLPNLPMITDVFTAKADGTIATMHHLAGLVEIPIKLKDGIENMMISTIQLESETSDFDPFFYAKPQSPYFVKFVTDRKASYLGEYSKITLTNELQSLFFVALPDEYNNYMLDVWKGSDNYKGTLENFRVERGKITKLKEVVIGN